MKKIIVLLFLLSSFIITNAQCWKSVSGGGVNGAAIKIDSTLWTWGDNTYGQLGNGTFSYSVRTVPGQLGTSHNWKSVSVGEYHLAALKTDGTLWTWGYNYSGQLGQGNNGPNTDLNIPTQVGVSNDWDTVLAANAYTVALKNDSTLWVWGSNYYGQLGDGTNIDKNIPIQIGSSHWKSISISGFNTEAIKTDGTLWSWGRNQTGELGDGTTTDKSIPIQIGTFTDWKSVCAAAFSTIAIRINGTLWAWGLNNLGQLGDGTGIDKYSPVQVGIDNNWKQVTGNNATLAIKNDSTLWAWGDNQYGTLGDGTNTNEYSPEQIGTSTDWKIVIAAKYGENEFAIKNDNTLWGWGYNGYGQIGDGTSTDKNILVQISCNSSLPITLVSFTAQKQYETILINWQTATEQNNKEYQIERSSDGTIFNKIGVVASNNSSSGSHYSYVDDHPLTGNNYYRLKSVDIDGKYSYSNIDEVTFAQSNEFIIYPNPAKDIITIENNFKGNDLNILITDLAGRKITQLIKPNNSILQLSVANLRTGLYILKITDGISSITQKLVKE